MTSLFFVAAAAFALQPGENPDDAAQARQRQIKRWSEYYRQEASAHKLSLADDSKQMLSMHPVPVAHWANPVRTGDTHGAVFVWTDRGRALAVGTIFSYEYEQKPGKRIVAHEFHSLAEQPLNDQLHGQTFWTPTKPGVKFQSIPNAPPVKQSSALRLSQMRSLARQFAAAGIDGNDVKRPLRLQPQPLYRYEPSAPNVLDGGLFAFVMGTDPELFLLIEAVETNGVAHWRFAPARFTHDNLELTHDGSVVWSYSTAGQLNSPTGSYYNRHGVTILDSLFTE